jgi:2-oxoglutarate ferredoxin oxidoreductase subunit gamma
MEYQIILAGFGGQGIMSAGRIITSAAMSEGKSVSWFPSYGPEMRGGTANCSVVISDQAIGSPIVNEPDALVALNEMSLDRFAPLVKPGGLVIADCSLAKNRPTRRDIRYIPVPASDMASEMGNMTFAAIILLGCLMRQTSCFGRESFEQALADTLPARYQHLIPAEMAAFDQGQAFAPLT